jgi:tripartite-type tricarboxylate transporter receptor subunit TctC
VPTVPESGHPGYDMPLWLAFFAPKGTPPPVIKRLESVLLRIVASSEMKELLTRQGVEPYSMGAADLGKLLKADIENYESVFKSAGIEKQ